MRHSETWPTQHLITKTAQHMQKNLEQRLATSFSSSESVRSLVAQAGKSTFCLDHMRHVDAAILDEINSLARYHTTDILMKKKTQRPVDKYFQSSNQCVRDMLAI